MDVSCTQTLVWFLFEWIVILVGSFSTQFMCLMWVGVEARNSCFLVLYCEQMHMLNSQKLVRYRFNLQLIKGWTIFWEKGWRVITHNLRQLWASKWLGLISFWFDLFFEIWVAFSFFKDYSDDILAKCLVFFHSEQLFFFFYIIVDGNMS